MNRQKIYRLLPVLLFAVFILFTWNCKKETKNEIPNLSTSSVSDITETTAVCGGTVTSDGGAGITSRGICWSAGRNPTINDNVAVSETSSGNFTVNLTSLIKNTTYYVMAFATNSAGTGYGKPVSFTTQRGSGTVIDFDGNVYDTVAIGTQVWLVQNLKVTHYRNGDPIDNRTDNTQWCNFISGSYCDYANDVNYVPVYGRLYNWYAVNDSRNIAPLGWHVASDGEWATLISFMGGENVAGGKLKETGTTHWTSPNKDATNEVGFTALPAGTRFGEYGIPGYGTFTKICQTSEWWTSNEQCTWGMSYDGADVLHSTDSRWTDGFSVRCIKDN
jgi:uncharacterized protein (TIGR02145 family)